MDIFLSYYHKNKAEADYIDQFFQDQGYIILRDTREVAFKGNLHIYCNRIRKCQAAITLISDAYLTSRWCMYEVLQLMKDHQFEKKIYPVVLDDAAIFNPKGRLKYIKYWNREFKELETEAQGLELSQSAELALELKLLMYIRHEIGTFTTTLAGWFLQKYGTLKQTNFQEILQTLPVSKYKLLIKLMVAQIQIELNKKLHVTEYIPMDLEYGVVSDKEDQQDKDETSLLTHGREWLKFNIQELLPLKKKYILSSSVGMGKTTFIYYLAGQLLAKGFLPLVFSCQEFEKVNPDTIEEMKEYFSKIYFDHSEGKLKKEIILELLKLYRKKLIFLFDGLDQIRSNDHTFIAGEIERVCKNYLFLITSRPSAVCYFESEKEYIFLRLQFFSQKALTKLFGENYKKARDMTSFAPDLIRTPMLAYMVKKLMEEGTEEIIQTRTELYQEFVAYIVRKHNRKDYQPTLARDIKKNLQKISYTALTLENPQIQKISSEHCYEQLENITCEQLITYGLVNLAIEKTDFLYFTHQSFQEYFAACYMKDKPKLIDRIIEQMWHPKWKEVIKFLAGFLGTGFLKRIYDRKDNVIHSRLFLVIECVEEIKEKEDEYIKKLQRDLYKIQFTYKEPFEDDIIKSHIALKNFYFVSRLLHDQDNYIRSRTAKALGKLGGNFSEQIITQLIELLRDPFNNVHWAARHALDNISSNFPKHIVTQLGELLNEQDKYVRESIVSALGNIGGDLPEEIIIQMVNLLRDQESFVRTNAAEVFGKIGDNLSDHIVTMLGELLYDQVRYVRISAAYALGKIGSNLPVQIITRLGELLHDQEWEIRNTAAEAIVKISSNLPEHIVTQLGELLRDQNYHVQRSAVEALYKICENLPEQIILQLVDLLRDVDGHISYMAANTLGKIGENLPEYIVISLIELLCDQNSHVRKRAADALGNIGEKLPEQFLIQLGKFLHDQISYVRISAADALGKIGGKLPAQIVIMLGELLRDQDSSVRCKVAYALGRIGRNLPEQIIKQLGELLRDQNSSVRCGVAYALGRIGRNLPEQIVMQLGELLHDHNRDVRCEAINAIGNIGGNLSGQIINHIGELLLDKDHRVRAMAANTLGNIGSNLPEYIIIQIGELLLDGNGDVGWKAEDALKKINNKIPDNLINKMEKNLNVRSYRVLKQLYEKGRNLREYEIK